jgi:hypothetical protein
LNAARLTGGEEEEEEDLDEKHGRRVFCWIERKINRIDITRVFLCLSYGALKFGSSNVKQCMTIIFLPS